MKLGEYEIFERIGTGGMAEVYRGRAMGEEGFEKPVAIKRILPHYGKDTRFVSMLVQEARIHASLHHRNIVQIHDLGQSQDGEYFIVLEYVDGRDLGALLEVMSKSAPPGNRMGDALALHVAIELGEGVHYAHQHAGPDGKLTGLVHRDVSPSNVLLSYAGEVKLSDFGLAKQQSDHSVIGSLKGKLAYMSPEQARRQPLDRRSDIFSLGAVLFEMLMGQRLRPIMDEADGWRQVASGAMTRIRDIRPDISQGLEQLLMRSLASNPDERFADGAAFVEAARDALKHVPRATSGEAAEMQLLLRSFLPAGAPRPRIEASRVIRIASQFLPPGEQLAHFPPPGMDPPARDPDRENVPTDKMRKHPTLQGMPITRQRRPDEVTPVAQVSEISKAEALADGNLFLSDAEIDGEDPREAPTGKTRRSAPDTDKTNVRPRPTSKTRVAAKPGKGPPADSLEPVAGEITGETKVKPFPRAVAAPSVHIPDVATRESPPVVRGGAAAPPRRPTPPPPAPGVRRPQRSDLPGMPRRTAPTPPPPPPAAATSPPGARIPSQAPPARPAQPAAAAPQAQPAEPPLFPFPPPTRDEGVIPYGGRPPGDTPVVARQLTPQLTSVSTVEPRGRRGLIMMLVFALVAGAAASVHYLFIPLPVLVQWTSTTKLRVTSKPPGATVMLDGVSLPDKTPLLVDVQRDRQDHTLQVEMTGYRTVRQGVRFDQDEALAATVMLVAGEQPVLNQLPPSDEPMGADSNTVWAPDAGVPPAADVEGAPPGGGGPVIVQEAPEPVDVVEKAEQPVAGKRPSARSRRKARQAAARRKRGRQR